MQFAVFRVDNAWQDTAQAERGEGVDSFLKSISVGDVVSHLYLTAGLKASSDIILWRIASSMEDLQDNFIALKRTGFGRRLADVALYTGVTKPSTYTKTDGGADALRSESERKRYLSFYPFTKTNDWYLLDYETRKKTMADHIAIGRRFPGVTQTLAYSFGADDQEFIVAYEMDDMRYYIDCVMALRESESRRHTKQDTPVYTGVRKTAAGFKSLFGGKNE